MTTVRELLTNKSGSTIFSIDPDASVYDSIKLMCDNNIGAVLVENNKGEVVGIISERDIIRKIDSKQLSAETISVREIMTGKVLFVHGDQSIEECMEIMISKNIRHLPVYQGDKLLGLLSIRDVLKQLIVEQKTMISHLENYINGF